MQKQVTPDSTPLPAYITTGNEAQTYVRITPAEHGSNIYLSNIEATRRWQLARAIHGAKYEDRRKRKYVGLDMLCEMPFVLTSNILAERARQAGLQVICDEYPELEDEARRILAPYSRHLPVEDDQGNIIDWRFEEGLIAEEDKQEAKALLDELGWGEVWQEGKWQGKTKHLFQFAYDGAIEILTKRDVLLSSAMGTGKTRLALCLALCWAKKDNSDKPIVILANKRHTGAWEEELGGIKEATPCELILKQWGEKPYETWYDKEDDSRLKFDKRFIIVSLDRAKLLKDNDRQRLIELCKGTTIILDESYIASNPHTALTKLILDLNGNHHIALSGTPIKSWVEQLCSILVWVHRGGSIALHEYGLHDPMTYKRWNRRFVSYAKAKDGSRKKVPLIANEEQFWELLAPLMYRRLRNEPEVTAILGHAETKAVEVSVVLDEAHLSSYAALQEGFKDWYQAEIEKKGMVGNSEALMKVGALVSQVRAPWTGEWGVPRGVTAVHRKALELIESELTENRKVIVFGVSRAGLELMHEEVLKAGYRAALIHGDVKHEDRADIVSKCRRGEVDVLLGSFGTIAEGLNLSFASTAIVLEVDWNPGGLQQALARITRGVQEAESRAYLLSARDTIGEYMMRVARLKAAAIARGLDKRELVITDIPDIAAYADSLIGTERKEREMIVKARRFY